MGTEPAGVAVERLAVGALQTNCYLVSDPERREMLVIDPGAEGERILRAVEASGHRVCGIVNTHGHFDHIGANGAIREATGAPLMIHEADAGWLAGRVAGVPVAHTVESPPADRLLSDGEEVAVGGYVLRVIHTPGHSEGGICLYVPGILFSGDTLFAECVGRTDLPGGSMSNLVSSVREKLMVLPDETVVYPGHGGATSIGDERSLNPFI